MVTEKQKDALGINSSPLLQAITSYNFISKCSSLHTNNSVVTLSPQHPSETFSRLSLLLILMFKVIDG